MFKISGQFLFRQLNNKMFVLTTYDVQVQLSFRTFLLLPLGFPVMERQQVSFVLSSFHLKVCLHRQAHLENK